ncbi:hypothetical protein Slin15195_G041410 [Septoria linicola]|uniref:Uncharacterized protein n=1 Tax=Septoria linicola TaxID=215465 RepID=A0A9Q9EIA4_9PEZI|nr:hypothetical protein Slin14017_G044930 [Septoria linicola]USW50822.1 hypothetical protein Slin15195_G041410 [Septoria linicola]
MAPQTLLSLPKDILVMLPEYVHNIEDYTNISSTCRTLRECMATATSNTILRLAAAQSNIFFRPSPYFLVTAVARELGNWARQSEENEAIFSQSCQSGIEGLFQLALLHCDLTTQRIREMYEMRMSIINPVTDIVDKCVGQQWQSTPRFWNGGVSDAYTIESDASLTFFHLAIYGELFSPDFEPFLTSSTTSSARKLKVETRLEFVRYCIPDPASDPDRRSEDPISGPYQKGSDGRYVKWPDQNNIALTWVIRSSRWRPHFKRFRTKVAGYEDFKDEFDDGWWYVPNLGADEEGGVDAHWRQRMWENLLVCQGLEGLGMIRPGLQDAWVEKVKAWREQIAALTEEPATVKKGKQATLEYPYLLGDLRICAAGYVLGTG